MICLKLRVIFWLMLVAIGSVSVRRLVQVFTIEATKLSNLPDISSDFDQQKKFELLDQLLWFIQVSDLHISIWNDPTRITEFYDFCLHTVPTISPSVVLASGDLTDAKTKDGLGSTQYEKEWLHYQDTLQKTGLFNTTLWLDVRGNHDTFDMPELGSRENFFALHSVQGKRHQRSYLSSVHQRGVDVAFIAVDATLLPGPRRPFNFVGVLPPSEYDYLRELAEFARSSHDFTVWFGHYPTSCILSPPTDNEGGLRSLMSSGVAYLCGHLHSLGGLVPAMYSRQNSGLLELELEDWKDGRMYRVMAIDHGHFVFVDVKHGEWPVILLSQPQHALFAPSKQSGAVRVLVWSIAALSRVAVRIGTDAEFTELEHVKGPLYSKDGVLDDRLQGVHTIQILAIDSDGRERIVEQPFSFDGAQLSFKFWPRLLLTSNISSVFQFLFGCSLCVTVVTLTAFKYLHYSSSKRNYVNICRGGLFRIKLVRAWVRKLWILSSINRIFWPVIIYMLYLPVGPWIVGELLDGHYGVIFAWGTFTYSSFLPGSLTFAYGFVLMLVYVMPLILCLAHCVDCRMCFLFLPWYRFSIVRQTLKNLPILMLLVLQSFLSYLMFLAYGWVTIIFCPIRSWSVVLGLVLWLAAERLQPDELKRAALLWYGEDVVKSMLPTHSLSLDNICPIDAWQTIKESGRVNRSSSMEATDSPVETSHIDEKSFCDKSIQSEETVKKDLHLNLIAFDKRNFLQKPDHLIDIKRRKDAKNRYSECSEETSR